MTGGGDPGDRPRPARTPEDGRSGPEAERTGGDDGDMDLPRLPPDPPPRRPEDGRAPDATPLTRPRHDARLDAERRMLESLVCPVTQTPLDYDRETQELISPRARLAFPIRDGIPILLVAEARQIDD